MHSRWTRPAFARSWSILFDGDFERNAKSGYEKHYEHVRSLVPSERLLEYNVKEGWDPLCKFLEVPHPGIEFPRGNDAVTLNKRFEAALKLTLIAIFKRLAFLALVVGGTGWALWSLWKGDLSMVRSFHFAL